MKENDFNLDTTVREMCIRDRAISAFSPPDGLRTRTG